MQAGDDESLTFVNVSFLPFNVNMYLPLAGHRPGPPVSLMVRTPPLIENTPTTTSLPFSVTLKWWPDLLLTNLITHVPFSAPPSAESCLMTVLYLPDNPPAASAT